MRTITARTVYERIRKSPDGEVSIRELAEDLQLEQAKLASYLRVLEMNGMIEFPDNDSVSLANDPD